MHYEVDIIKSPVGQADDVLLSDNISDDSSPLLTIPEVAKVLRISPTGVRRLQQDRKITFIKVGGSVRFHKEDVDSFLRKQRVKVIE